MTQPGEAPPSPASRHTPAPSMPDFRPRSRGPLLFAGGGGLVVGALVTAAVMTATRPAPRRVAPAPSASASAGPGASASVAPPAS
ncbi:MAG: hypothetical protein OZ921_17685, partial [Sorangiineae bacterium]|nr:hypothetical protein [Sorangiineae bacterium]